jgi:hypothetical protein
VTDPLTPLFAQLEKAVEDAFRIELDECTGPKYEVFLNQQRDGRLAALSAIKLHVQDTETALKKIVGLRMPDGFGPGSSLMEAKAIARAALPAREKEEDWISREMRGRKRLEGGAER